jgi:hypothetical protein
MENKGMSKKKCGISEFHNHQIKITMWDQLTSHVCFQYILIFQVKYYLAVS